MMRVLLFGVVAITGCATKPQPPPSYSQSGPSYSEQTRAELEDFRRRHPMKPVVHAPADDLESRVAELESTERRREWDAQTAEKLANFDHALR